MKVSSTFQKYKITQRLKTSSASTERFLAEQAQLNRKVELRIVCTSASKNPTLAKRFNRELSLLAGLDHPGIIKILDVGSFDDRLFYTTVHRRAKSLESLLRETKTPFSVKEVLKLALTISDAMRHMHKKGVIHRSISTKTLYYDLKNLRSYIGEFEMVKTAQEENLEQSSWNEDNEAFHIPEGVTGAALDERSDLYMLGAVMYRLLTLKRAKAGKNENIKEPSSYNDKVPEQLDVIVLRLLENIPEKRYQDCASLITDLEGIYRI